jgi:DNA-binding LacI/PurR family transcriptional regulator
MEGRPTALSMSTSSWTTTINRICISRAGRQPGSTCRRSIPKIPVVSNIENPFFLDVCKAVETGAHAEGYEVIMANTDYRSEQLVASVRLMIGWRVAGLAAIVSEMDRN